MASSSISRKDVEKMNLDQLCEILETKNIDYSCLGDIEEIRDLVLQSICHQELSTNEDILQEQVPNLK